MRPLHALHQHLSSRLHSRKYASLCGTFAACGAWQEAADMYREEGEWVEAERVAVAAGGAAAGTRMKILHAREILKTQSPEAAVQMLLKVIELDH